MSRRVQFEVQAGMRAVPEHFRNRPSSGMRTPPFLELLRHFLHRFGHLELRSPAHRRSPRLSGVSDVASYTNTISRMFTERSLLITFQLYSCEQPPNGGRERTRRGQPAACSCVLCKSGQTDCAFFRFHHCEGVGLGKDRIEDDGSSHEPSCGNTELQLWGPAEM